MHFVEDDIYMVQMGEREREREREREKIRKQRGKRKKYICINEHISLYIFTYFQSEPLTDYL